MAALSYCFSTLKLDLDEKPGEITIHCNGKITSESAYMFEREVRENSLPVSRGKGVAVINRVVLDLTNVTHVDNDGLKALLDIWTAGQRKCCTVEIINRASQMVTRSFSQRFDWAIRSMRELFE